MGVEIREGSCVQDRGQTTKEDVIETILKV